MTKHRKKAWYFKTILIFSYFAVIEEEISDWAQYVSQLVISFEALVWRSNATAFHHYAKTSAVILKRLSICNYWVTNKIFSCERKILVVCLDGWSVGLSVKDGATSYLAFIWPKMTYYRIIDINHSVRNVLGNLWCMTTTASHIWFCPTKSASNAVCIPSSSSTFFTHNLFI